MILFYSSYCSHCNILLETIQKHDKNKMIKLVSIDTLRSLKKPIDPKIHSVPALLLLTTKEYLFGKAVFDYLLLPSRGILFSGQTTRDEKRPARDIDDNVSTIENTAAPGEPRAFVLGSISAEQFSTIDDENSIVHDKNYNWDTIDTSNTMNTTPSITPAIKTDDSDSSSKKKLPSMEEIMKQRALDFA